MKATRKNNLNKNSLRKPSFEMLETRQMMSHAVLSAALPTSHGQTLNAPAKSGTTAKLDVQSNTLKKTNVTVTKKTGTGHNTGGVKTGHQTKPTSGTTTTTNPSTPTTPTNPTTPAPPTTTPTTPVTTTPTVDNPVTPTTTNSPDSNDASAPRSVISVNDASVPLGSAVFVNGLGSTIRNGTALNSEFDWDFGDAGSKYNNLTGFNAAHAYDRPGTYTVTLKVTDEAGKQTTVSTQVTVMASTRRQVFVSSSGNDSNNGGSQNAAVKSFARAAQLAADNTEILFERGGTYRMSEAMNLGFTNIAVNAYGTGSKPVMMYTGALDYNAVFMTLNGNDVSIRNVAFDSTNTTLSEVGYNQGVRAGGENIVIRDCSFINVGYAINTNAMPEGILVQDNDCPNVKGLREYFAWVQGSDHVYLGNRVLDSVQSHIIRVAGADRVLIAQNDFTNLASTAMRPTLTLHKGNYVYVANNKLTGSAVGVGPLDSGAGYNDKTARLKNAVLERNIITDSPVNVSHGTEGISIRDNVINDDDSTVFNLPGYSPSYERGTKEVYIVRNTVINNGTVGTFLKVGGAVDDITVSNNLYYAPNYVAGKANSAVVSVRTGDLSGFTTISNNIWPDATILTYAKGGVNYVGSAGDSSGYKTPQAWENYSEVVNDQYRDVTLTSSYRVSLGGISAGSDLARAA